MLVSAKDVLSLEGISHRANTKLFSDVVDAFETIRNDSRRLTTRARSNEKILDDANVVNIVRAHTGLSIKFKSGPEVGINAYVMPPHLDKNHPLLSDVHRYYYSNNDAKRRIKMARGAIQGEIDLSTGKVSGVYTKITSEVFVASQILQGDLFTSEEAAAVFLHEIGHLMTYYEYLGRNVLINHVMEDVHKEYTKSGTDRHRVELLEVTKKGLGLDDIDPELAAQAKKEATFRSLIVSELARETHSATGTPYYDLRTWEALADQYVSRLGGGRALAIGLDKIHRYYGVQGYESNTVFLISEIFSVLFATIFLPFTVLFMLMNKMPFDIYDPPKDRLDRIRKDLIAAMKDPKIDSEYRRRIKADVDAIEALMKDIQPRETTLLKLWKMLSPDLRKQFDRAKLVQELEALKDNTLFVRFNTLKSMES